ncbi:MAG: choice-of-anchor J domain-containing protein [Muribaculaceae bacterium]|nr:choice-of-anchor J domain-containing protein [Muribaculaceae bacterium]
MKSLKSYISMLLLGVVAATSFSCDEEFDRPPIVLPTPDHEATTTIADFKKSNWTNDGNAAKEIGDEEYIKGVITSDDTSGNIYKSITIEDETGAISFSVNNNKLNADFKLGQKVVIGLKGAWIGKYNGLMQVGDLGSYNNNPTITFMDKDDFAARVEFDGLPEPNLLKPTKLTLAEINASKEPGLNQCLLQSLYVELDDVYFVDGGKATFAEGTSNTNRTLKDKDGNTIIVRNSGYATFAGETLPFGTGKVRGILSYYGSDWQILLRDASDCFDFDGQDPNPPIVVDPTTLLEENFEAYSKYDTPTVLVGWRSYMVKGNKDWYVNEFDNNKYIACTAYKGTDVNGYEAWLVTPPLDFKNMTDKVLSFAAQELYTGDSKLNVYIMDTDDPASATKKVTVPVAQIGTSEFINTGDISIPDLFSNAGVSMDVGYLAFVYTSSTSSASKTIGIDNILVGKKSGIQPPTPVETATYELVNFDSVPFESGAHYIIVAGDQAVTPIPSGKTYGWPGQTGVTIEETTGYLKADESLEFILTEVPGMAMNFPVVYMQDVVNSRYYYMTGTYNNFNVDANIPSEGEKWELAPTYDGSGFVNIVNLEKNKAWRLFTDKSSFGAYDEATISAGGDAYVKTKLYKRITLR